jgi:hypothetical protein
VRSIDLVEDAGPRPLGQSGDVLGVVDLIEEECIALQVEHLAVVRFGGTGIG